MKRFDDNGTLEDKVKTREGNGGLRAGENKNSSYTSVVTGAYSSCIISSAKSYQRFWSSCFILYILSCFNHLNLRLLCSVHSFIYRLLAESLHVLARHAIHWYFQNKLGCEMYDTFSRTVYMKTWYLHTLWNQILKNFLRPQQRPFNTTSTAEWMHYRAGWYVLNQSQNKHRYSSNIDM